MIAKLKEKILLLSSRQTKLPIVVVSGLPRSGTSMMMKMLQAGGMPVLIDELRIPDADNPNGYYQFERVKQLNKGDYAWLKDAEGKAVKIISALLPNLPVTYSYKIIFMQRQYSEVIHSQQKMLVHRGESTERMTNEELIRIYENHLQQVYSWVRSQQQISMFTADYNSLIYEPIKWITQITRFVDLPLDQQKMTNVIDSHLYRNRLGNT